MGCIASQMKLISKTSTSNWNLFQLSQRVIECGFYETLTQHKANTVMLIAKSVRSAIELYLISAALLFSVFSVNVLWSPSRNFTKICRFSFRGTSYKQQWIVSNKSARPRWVNFVYGKLISDLFNWMEIMGKYQKHRKIFLPLINFEVL